MKIKKTLLAIIVAGAMSGIAGQAFADSNQWQAQQRAKQAQINEQQRARQAQFATQLERRLAQQRQQDQQRVLQAQQSSQQEQQRVLQAQQSQQQQQRVLQAQQSQQEQQRALQAQQSQQQQQRVLQRSSPALNHESDFGAYKQNQPAVDHSTGDSAYRSPANVQSAQADWEELNNTASETPFRQDMDNARSAQADWEERNANQSASTASETPFRQDMDNARSAQADWEEQKKNEAAEKARLAEEAEKRRKAKHQNMLSEASTMSCNTILAYKNEDAIVADVVKDAKANNFTNEEARALLNQRIARGNECIAARNKAAAATKSVSASAHAKELKMLETVSCSTVENYSVRDIQIYAQARITENGATQNQAREYRDALQNRVNQCKPKPVITKTTSEGLKHGDPVPAELCPTAYRNHRGSLDQLRQRYAEINKLSPSHRFSGIHQRNFNMLVSSCSQQWMIWDW